MISSVEEAIEHHRRTRRAYMHAARRAHAAQLSEKFILNWLYYDKMRTPEKDASFCAHFDRRVFAKAAMRCFIRHARASNRKLLSALAMRRFMASLPSTYSQPFGI